MNIQTAIKKLAQAEARLSFAIQNGLRKLAQKVAMLIVELEAKIERAIIDAIRDADIELQRQQNLEIRKEQVEVKLPLLLEELRKFYLPIEYEIYTALANKVREAVERGNNIDLDFVNSKYFNSIHLHDAYMDMKHTLSH